MKEFTKPDCELIGQDGNIFNLIGIAQKTLHQHGLHEQSKEMANRIMVKQEAQSYIEAIAIIQEYVNITGPETDLGQEMSI